MDFLLNFIAENTEAQVGAVIIAVFQIISIIIRLTPTKKDDEIRNKFLKTLSIIVQGTRTKK